MFAHEHDDLNNSPPSQAPVPALSVMPTAEQAPAAVTTPTTHGKHDMPIPSALGQHPSVLMALAPRGPQYNTLPWCWGTFCQWIPKAKLPWFLQWAKSRVHFKVAIWRPMSHEKDWPGWPYCYFPTVVWLDVASVGGNVDCRGCEWGLLLEGVWGRTASLWELRCAKCLTKYFNSSFASHNDTLRPALWFFVTDLEAKVKSYAICLMLYSQ